MTISFGASVTFGSASLGTLIDVSGSGLQAGVVDTSNQASTNGYKTYDFSGLIDPGEITLKIITNGTPAAVGTKGTLTVVWASTGATWSCSNAICQSYDPQSNLGTQMTASVKFKLSGQTTVSGGS
jgi:hypothetical protein